MRLLTESERSSASADVRQLITASGQEATLLRKAEDENLYGSDEGEFAKVGTFPLEFAETPQDDLAKAVDATVCVLPDLDVRMLDRVRFGGELYRVQTIVEQSLFGVVTHKVLELVKIHGG